VHNIAGLPADPGLTTLLQQESQTDGMGSAHNLSHSWKRGIHQLDVFTRWRIGQKRCYVTDPTEGKPNGVWTSQIVALGKHFRSATICIRPKTRPSRLNAMAMTTSAEACRVLCNFAITSSSRKNDATIRKGTLGTSFGLGKPSLQQHMGILFRVGSKLNGNQASRYLENSRIPSEVSYVN
jgi:hypothetical protein